jgi:hypothetical protein
VASGAHALVIVLATVLLPTKEIAAGLDLRRFARIEIIDPAEPEEEEKEEEEEEEESEDKRPEKAKKKTPKAKKKASKSKFAGGGGVLGALQRFNKAKIGKTSVAAMISGISAVKGRSGAGGFQVAGTGEGIPGGKLVVGGRAGGAGLRTGTRGIKDLFAKGARAKLKGRKGSKVRGQVRAQKRSVRMKGTGSLDKALIAKVVAKNIGQVRYCYERTLLKEPSIRGKVVLEWSIGLSGKVTRVKEKFSSLNSSAMTGCIIGKVKGWKFPKPRGGQVIVSYPFIFNSVGF